MKIDIIVVYIQRYERGHEVDFVPPITGIHLAAITPPRHRVRVIHQQVEPVRLRHGRRPDRALVLQRLRAGGLPAGGRVQAARKDRGRGRSPRDLLARRGAAPLRQRGDRRGRVGLAAAARRRRGGRAPARYDGEPSPMRDLPTPRYDLLPKRFFVPRVAPGDARLPVHLLLLHGADPQPGLSHAAGRRRRSGRPLRRLPLLVAAQGRLVLGRQPHDHGASTCESCSRGWSRSSAGGSPRRAWTSRRTPRCST